MNRVAQPDPTAVPRYDAFLSYSHAPEPRLAAVLQTGIERFAVPWYRRRALRIFRDNASLSANPHLWSSIEQAMSTSRWFILMASPGAASSTWVNRETAFWCAHQSPDRMLVVLTDGEIGWDDVRNDFDWGVTTALPPSLKGVFSGEPRHIDLRWARSHDQVSARHGRFKDAVAEIAAPLHGRSKDEMFGDEVRQQRRAQRLVRSIIAVLTVLVVLVASSTAIALRQRDDARRERDIAASRYIAAQAVAHQGNSLSRSLLESVAALDASDTTEARKALFGSLQANPRVHSFLHGVFGATAFSPDGTSLAYRRGDRLELSEIGQKGAGASSVPLPRDTSLQPSTEAVAFDPSGDRVVVVTDEGLAVQWDRRTGTQLGGVVDIGGAGILGTVALAPDGRTAAVVNSGGDGSIALWDLVAFRQAGVLPGPFFFGMPMAFSSDGRILATGSPERPTGANDGSIVLWGVASRERIGVPLRGHLGRVRELALNTDGSLLASTDTDGTIRLWDTTGGSERHRLVGNTREVSGMAFTPGSETLVSTAGDGSVVLWDVAGGRLRERLLGHDSSIGAPTIGPDGARLAVGGSNGTIVLWNLDQQGSRLAEVLIGAGAPVTHLSFSPEGTELGVAREDGRVGLWNVGERRQDGSAIAAVEAQDGPDDVPYVRALFSANGTLVTLEDDHATVTLWEGWPSALHGRRLDLGARTNSSGAFSPDGSLLAVGTNDGSVVIWELRAGKPAGGVPSDGSGTRVSEVVFSPDGAMLAVVADTTVRLWDLGRDRQRGERIDLPPSPPNNIAFDPTGRRLTVGLRNGTIQVWDTRTTKLVGQPTDARPKNFDSSLAVAPDGAMLATGGTDGSIVLWDLAGGEPFGTPLPGHTGAVRALAFSPDGKTLASGGNDGAVILWEVEVDVWREKACALANRTLAGAEWAALRRGGEARQPCT